MNLEKTRKINKCDAKILVNILITGVKPYVSCSLLKHSKMKSITSKFNNFIILRNKSTIAGFLMYRILRDNIAFIYEIHVVAEFQSQGYGTKMMNTLFEQEKGKVLVLFVHNENLKAQKFYKSLGFEKTEEDGCYFKMTKNS